MTNTAIEWSEKVWNPVRGCSRVSPGCQRCYAERMGGRFCGEGQHWGGFVQITNGGPRWTGRVELLPAKLDEPLRMRKPAVIFVNSTSDLFHEKLADQDIEAAFDVMWRCEEHRFLILTKRHERMVQFIRQRMTDQDGDSASIMPHIVLGVSVENQEYANKRLPVVCELGEAGWNTMVSLEPLLGPVVLPERFLRLGKRTWVIVGGESGPGARPFDVEWARTIIDQCKRSGTCHFVKQLGSLPVDSSYRSGLYAPYDKRSLDAQRALGLDHVGFHLLPFHDAKGGNPAEWPADLRVREVPEFVRLR